MVLEISVQTTRKSAAYSDKFLTGISITEPYSGSANVEDVFQSWDITRDFYFKSKNYHIWSEKRDPITQSNLIENEEEEVQELIYQLKTSSVRYRNEIANRLITLFKDSKEEDPYATGITAGSLRNFINFLELYPNVKHPSISLTPEHNIYVSWRDKYNRVFSIHFLPNKDTRFVIFTPNYRHPEQKIRLSGIATVDVLLETVAPYGLTDWIFDER